MPGPGTEQGPPISVAGALSSSYWDRISSQSERLTTSLCHLLHSLCNTLTVKFLHSERSGWGRLQCGEVVSHSDQKKSWS